MVHKEHSRSLIWVRAGLGLYGALLGVGLLFTALRSFGWRIVHDSPLMLYVAYWLGRGKVPYRDFFDVNLPGTYFMNFILGEIAGYSNDLGFRIGDIVLLLVILLCTAFALRTFRWIPALFAPICFGLVYLEAGPFMSFQREYLTLLPMSVAVLIGSFAPTRRSYRGFAFGIGFLTGWVALIKPHAAVALPLIALGIAGGARQLKVRQPYIKAAVWALVGMAVPLAAAIAYLYAQGSLDALYEIYRNYGPAYLNVNGNHETVSGWQRLHYLVTTWARFGGHFLWGIGAVLGVYVALHHANLGPGERRQVKVLAALGVYFCLYPAVTTRFFFYHWLPFVYFATVLTSLCFLAVYIKSSLGTRLFYIGAGAVVIMLQIQPGLLVANQPTEEPFLASPFSGGRSCNRKVDPVALFLSTNLQPGDTVQPLDTTHGAIHAMLLSGAELATPFMYDAAFYHHVSRPFTKTLRERYMAALEAKRPRYVLYVDPAIRHFVTGPDTTTAFPEQERFLEENYRVELIGFGYTIYESLDAEPTSVPLTRVASPRPQGTPWCEPGNLWIGPDGLDVGLGERRFDGSVTLSLESNDTYELQFYSGEILVGQSRVPALPEPGEGLTHRTIAVSPQAVGRGYDRIRIVPVEGDGIFVLGHLVLKK